MTASEEKEVKGVKRTTSLSFYKAKANGKGSAVRFELYPAREGNDGYISVCAANQRSAANALVPSFDWDRGIGFKLFLTDVAEVLRVLRGECDDLCEGKGIYFSSAYSGHRSVTVRLGRFPEGSLHGLSLEVVQKEFGGLGEIAETRVFFVFSDAEALGLCLVLETSLGVLAFGVPSVA